MKISRAAFQLRRQTSKSLWRPRCLRICNDPSASPCLFRLPRLNEAPFRSTPRLVLCGTGGQAEGTYASAVALAHRFDIVADVPESAVVRGVHGCGGVVFPAEGGGL